MFMLQTSLLFIWVSMASCAEVILQTSSLAQLNWNSLPKDDDKIFHSWSFRPDGSMSLVAHQRSLLSCDNIDNLKGLDSMTIPFQTRKLTQIASDTIGEILNQQIIGSDDRIRIEQTETFPASAVGLIVFETLKGRRGTCTGTMISSNVMLTSGHCLFDHDEQQLFSDFEFYPGRNGILKPFGSLVWDDISISGGWVVNGSLEDDYGVIKFKTPIGDEVGVFGYGIDCGLESNSADLIYTLTGYPNDKGDEQWASNCNIQPFDPCVNSDGKPLLVQHNCDTLGGQSGSVMWKVVNGRPTIRAIHQGFTDSEANNAIAITDEVFDFILRNSDFQ